MRLLAVCILVSTGLCLGAAPASAHAVLVDATPADGATLQSAPTAVVLRFSENIRTPSTIVVTGPGGRVSDGTVRVVDNTVSVDVHLEAKSAFVGHYDFAYRVVSADGHPVAGQLSFDYRPPGVAAAPASKDGPAVEASDGLPWGWLVAGVAVVVVVAGLLFGGRTGRVRRSRSRQ